MYMSEISDSIPSHHAHAEFRGTILAHPLCVNVALAFMGAFISARGLFADQR